MSVPVSTAVEVTGNPAEYKSGEMNSMVGDGTRKVAFVTGTTGQDGSYLVELLLSKGTRTFARVADLAQIVPRLRLRVSGEGRDRSIWQRHRVH